ncbi:hypothetical protein D4S03_01090 [bacterium]|nr:MAG: hypothetical protein D4S03_01090 [bacterium]
MSYTLSIADKGQVETSPASGFVVDLVTLAEAKNYLKQDYGTLTVEDTLVKDLIQSARTWIEQWIGQSIIKKTITAYTSDEMEYFTLPMPPINTITTVHRIALDGTATLLTLNTDYYSIGVQSITVCMYPVWSTSGGSIVGLKVVYDAYMAEVPKAIKEACLALVSHMYFNRGADVGMPAGVIDKLKPFRKL